MSKLSKTNAPSKRALAREYNVNEGAIWKVWDNQEAILERFALLSEEGKEKTFRVSVGRFIELEDMLYIWIDSMHCAKLLVPPSFAIAKAKSIASSLSTSEFDFKASWHWLSRFRARCGLQKMLNNNDSELLATLKELYEIIAQYDPENVYNMDKTGLFFRLFSRYLRQMTIHDMFN